MEQSREQKEVLKKVITLAYEQDEAPTNNKTQLTKTEMIVERLIAIEDILREAGFNLD